MSTTPSGAATCPHGCPNDSYDACDRNGSRLECNAECCPNWPAEQRTDLAPRVSYVVEAAYLGHAGLAGGEGDPPAVKRARAKLAGVLTDLGLTAEGWGLDATGTRVRLWLRTPAVGERSPGWGHDVRWVGSRMSCAEMIRALDFARAFQFAALAAEGGR